ncbi:PREDICTED: mitochondrial dicarboxylate carrier, partial [Myotis brandtii]|uniref:mitochondrial dicarboxylate carrier n=1 Tax=Myotis brandtii TaxID=109478 RepID=UPI000703FAD3
TVTGVSSGGRWLRASPLCTLRPGDRAGRGGQGAPSSCPGISCAPVGLWDLRAEVPKGGGCSELRNSPGPWLLRGSRGSSWGTPSPPPREQRRPELGSLTDVAGAPPSPPSAEGLRKLFSGATMASSRGMLVTVGQLSCYDQAKQLVLGTGYLSDGIFTHFIASFIAVSARRVCQGPVPAPGRAEDPPDELQGRVPGERGLGVPALRLPGSGPGVANSCSPPMGPSQPPPSSPGPVCP